MRHLSWSWMYVFILILAKDSSEPTAKMRLVLVIIFCWRWLRWGCIFRSCEMTSPRYVYVAVSFRVSLPSLHFWWGLVPGPIIMIFYFAGLKVRCHFLAKESAVSSICWSWVWDSAISIMSSISRRDANLVGPKWTPRFADWRASSMLSMRDANSVPDRTPP